MAVDDLLVKRVRRMLSAKAVVTEKRMIGGLGFIVNGHLCCGVVGSDLVVRVGAENVAGAIAHEGVRQMQFRGKSLKAFVSVSPAGYRSTARLRRWIDRGLRYLMAGA